MAKQSRHSRIDGKLQELFSEGFIVPNDGGGEGIRMIEMARGRLVRMKYDYFVKKHWLGKALKGVIKAAIKARGNAYSPYFDYKVGAALLAANWKIYTGCNVELATSRTTHAERNAIDTMVADGEREILVLVCVSKNGGIPCSECRQPIWEFAGKDKNVYIVGLSPEKDEVSVTKIQDLYPWPFGPEDLEVDPTKH